MKLKNKKTGEIRDTEDWCFTAGSYSILFGDTVYGTLAELCEEWEDYKEPKSSALDLIILTLTDFVENEPDEDKVDLEDCKQMLDKLKAWKRLKDKGADFVFVKSNGICGNGCRYSIELCTDISTFTDDNARSDLDLLFGGKE